jgi:hypothetical protein
MTGSKGSTGRRLRASAWGSALLLLCAVAAPLDAQERMITVSAGPAQYDLSGTGTTPSAAVRALFPIHRRFAIEPSIGWLSYESQAERRRTLWFLEGQILFQRSAGRVRPFLGVGSGYAWEGGDDTNVGTLSASVGALLGLDDAWGLRGELRIRAIDPWVGTTAEWGFGITRRF